MANDNLHGHTILVIEAEPFIRLNLSNSLTAAGARVLSARNAGDALAVIERSELGAAILDFTLGETGCSEVYQRLVESGVPVVIHTSDPTVLVAEKCPNALVVRKPSPVDALVEILARLCLSGRVPGK